MSETLREKEGYGEVADEQDGHDESDRVRHAHNRSTPLTTSAVTAKNATVRIRKIRSAIHPLH
jgi:hypothetical protein